MKRISPLKRLRTKYASGLRISERARGPIPSLAAILLLLFAVLPAEAQLTIVGEQVGPDVVFTISGAFDPGTPDATDVVGEEAALFPGEGTLEAVQTESNANEFDLDVIVPFGPGGETVDGIVSGHNFLIREDTLSLDDTYVPGTPFNTTLTFAGKTFSSLGVNVDGGPYVWTITNSGATITMQLPKSAQPVADNSALKTSLNKKIKKLQKKAKQAKKKGQSAKAKSLNKKAKKLQNKLRALG